MNEAISNWRQAGRLCLWQYKNAPRMYRGWHFTGDRAGGENLLLLIELLGAHDQDAARTLSLEDPLSVGAEKIFRGHQTPLIEPAGKLRLSNRPADATAEELTFAEGIVTLRLGHDGLTTLADSIRDVLAGTADFGVGFGGTIAMFWWMVRQS